LAFKGARSKRHEFMTVEHLLLALIDNDSAASVLRACGADLTTLRKELIEFVDSTTPLIPENDTERETQPTLGFQRVLQRAVFHVQVADAYGAHFEQTLTGFKWIANAALDLEAQGVGTFVFGYEEALGYTVGGHVRDKDGLSAGLVFMDLAASLRDEGATVSDRMADLYRRAGLWVSTQLSLVRPGTEGVAEIAAAMRRLGETTPTHLDGREVV